jgi:hypothetical protein
MKKSMIVSPARNFVLSVAAGFVFNLSFMASIIIIYEEYTNASSFDYSASMVPLIVLLSALMVIVILTIFSLAVDLLDKGCLVWHRESLGHLL